MLAAVIVAEIGDIRRFPGPGQLASWAGLTPRHYESDTKVIRGARHQAGLADAALFVRTRRVRVYRCRSWPALLEAAPSHIVP